MQACFVTLGVRAPLPELRQALMEVWPFSEAGAVPHGAVRSAFPPADALLLLTIDDGKEDTNMRSARSSQRRWRRSEAVIRGIVAHLVPRFGNLRFCVERRQDASPPARTAPSLSHDDAVTLEEFLSSENGLPEQTLVTVSAN